MKQIFLGMKQKVITITQQSNQQMVRNSISLPATSKWVNRKSGQKHLKVCSNKKLKNRIGHA
jgi:hypothetical protein